MIDNTVRNPEPLTGETIFLAYRTKMHRKLDIRAIHPITYIFFFSSFIFVILIFFPLFFFSRYLFLQPRRSLSFRTCRHFFPRRDSTNVRCARKFENSIVSRIRSKFVREKRRFEREATSFSIVLRKIYINNQGIWSNYVLWTILESPQVRSRLYLDYIIVAWLHNCLVTDRETRFCDWFWPTRALRNYRYLLACSFVRGTRG